MSQDIIKITWDDAGAFGDPEATWTTKEEIVDNYKNGQFMCVSTGILIYEDGDSVILAQSIEEEFGQYSTPFRIPKIAIIKRVKLTESIEGE
jgi:hypothetical protein